MKIFKTLILMTFGFLLMGNKGCEDQPAVEAPKARVLKKIVDVGLITSAMIDMPGGQKFDFQYVANQQIYPVLQASEGFFFRYKPPFAQSPSMLGSNIRFSDVNLTTNDVAMLERNFSTNVIPQPTISEEVSCLVNLPQYRINGSVNAFELKSKMGLGLSIGFANGASLTSNGLPGVNFGVDTYQLDMTMHAVHPITAAVSASSHVTAKQTATKLEFNLPIASLLLNPSFYFQTPLATVSYNALSSSVKQIKAQLDAIKDKPWFTRVLVASEGRIVILAGSLHNVEVGDTFDIYNEKVYWLSNNGSPAVPCESTYNGSNDGDKVATIEIKEMTEETAVGVVLWQSGAPIKMGSKVKVNKLAEPAVATTAATSKTK